MEVFYHIAGKKILEGDLFFALWSFQIQQLKLMFPLFFFYPLFVLQLLLAGVRLPLLEFQFMFSLFPIGLDMYPFQFLLEIHLWLVGCTSAGALACYLWSIRRACISATVTFSCSSFCLACSPWNSGFVLFRMSHVLAGSILTNVNFPYSS